MTDLRIGSMLVEDGGEGPAVIMVHGLGGTSNSFQTLVNGLSGYRILRPDLPGAGRSPLRPGLSSLRRLSTCLKDCMQAAGLERAHFVGHSMGTLLCQYLAEDSPSCVSSMVLFGPILEPPEGARQALKERAETARSGGMTEIADAIMNGSVSRESRKDIPAAAAFVRESILRQSGAGYAAQCEALSEARAADHSKIRCPTLLVVGEEDPVAPLNMARQFQIDGARLEIVPRVGHWMMVESADRSTELLGDHLNEHALNTGD